MEKLTNGMKGLDCITRQPDPWKYPIPKTGDETDDDVFKALALLGTIGGAIVLAKVLTDGWDW